MRFYKSCLIIYLMCLVCGITHASEKASTDGLPNNEKNRVLDPPTISSFTPDIGIIGSAVTITGTGFTGATAVTFGGEAADSFTVNSDTEIIAVVDSGTSGEVAVTTVGGTGTKEGFLFINTDRSFFDKQEDDFECYDKSPDESNVCSGNGGCLAPNQCACDLNYGGSRCQTKFAWQSTSTASVSSTYDFVPALYMGVLITDSSVPYFIDIAVKKLELYSEAPRGIHIGLVDFPLDNDEHNVGLKSTEYGYESLGGYKVNNNNYEDFGEPYGEGDTVRVIFNLRERIVSFALKKQGTGEFVLQGDGAAFTDVDFEGDPAFGLSLQCYGDCEFELVSDGADELVQVPDIVIKGTESDFGEVNVGNNKTLDFAIENIGNGDLEITGDMVSITGADAEDFSVTFQPSGTITPGGLSYFTVASNPSSSGSKAATLSITNNDPSEGNFTFDIAAEATGTNVSLEVTAFLEGAFNGTDLNTTLNPKLPLTQPYSINGHNGGEAAANIPANAVDWVLVELREAADAASALESTKVGSAAGFLMSDGSIKGLDGVSNLSIVPEGNSGEDFFVVIYHRNHLPIMSANAVSAEGESYSIDFTSSSSSTYQGVNAMADLGDGKFGLISGDADGDGDVDEDDLVLWRSQNGTAFTYDLNSGDFNLDAVFNAVDRNAYLKANKEAGKTTAVPKNN